MRIGLVSADFAPNVGGVASHVVELGRALAALGHEIHVITLPLGGQRQARSTWQGMQIHRPGIPKAKPLYSWLVRRFLKRLIRQENIEIIHVHGLRPLEASQGLSVPVIFTNHTSGYLMRIEKGPREQAKMRKRMAHVHHVLAPSEELAEATRRVGYENPVDFISNGVDVRRFAPGVSSLREAHGISPDEVVVLLARRLVEKNGVTVYAEAVSALKGHPVRLLFAGDGPDRSEVERLLVSGGVADLAIFLGNIDNSQMPDIYRAADLSVLPSRREATSITGLESMATGLPLVGTRVGGIPFLIEDQETGLLVPPDDPPALGAALRKLVEDAPLRKRLGAAARVRAEARFDWSRIAEATAKVYGRYLS
ncbi:MAG: glycosyltransferase family 4 protein [Magnetococcales bacterium]|nr:glycosyltransferase family 4 protein [Magnetococcales bacterium]